MRRMNSRTPPSHPRLGAGRAARAVGRRGEIRQRLKELESRL